MQDGKVNDRECDRKCKSLQECYCLWIHNVGLLFQLLIDLVKCKMIKSMIECVIGSARMVLFVEYTLYAYFFIDSLPQLKHIAGVFERLWSNGAATSSQHQTRNSKVLLLALGHD